MRTVICLLCISVPLAAQSAAGNHVTWDLTAGKGKEATSLSLGASKGVSLIGNRLRLGLGLRTTWAGGDLKLTPAGAHNVPVGVIDTLSVSSAALMLNVSGHVAIGLTDRLHVGMNIDLVGFGAGSSRNATYRASASTAPTLVKASPSINNLFLYGSKDRGSLNSEFFGAWKFSDHFTFRGGLSHQLVEYSAERELSSNTRRFRRYSNLFFLGLRLTR